MIYFISDTHFGHKGSLKWPNGNARDFESITEMDNLMIQNWNKTVIKEDTVYFLGDFSYKASKNHVKYILNQLNGEIIFIKGNHDGMTLKANQGIHRFHLIYDICEFEYENKYFVLCHYPMESWRMKEKGSIHLHGHVHNNPKFDRVKNRMDVSVEAIDYKPISIDEIIKHFEDETNTQI